LGSVETVKDFDRLLVQAIDETIEYCLGEANTSIIHNYLEERNLPMSEVPNKPELFSEELRNVLGFGSTRIHCAASILEETILEVLCKKLGTKLDCERPPNFPRQVRKLRRAYYSEGDGR
jgi:hypothetical protein